MPEAPPTDLEQWVPNFPVDKEGFLNFSSIFIARRHSGKTFMIKHFMETLWKDRFDLYVVFTTQAGIDEYAEFTPGRLLFDGFDANVIEVIKQANAKLKAKGERPLNTLIIMDDQASRKQKYNSEISNLYMKGRHDNMSIVYTTQTPTFVSVEWKENSDLLFVFKPLTTHNRHYITKSIISGIMDTAAFETVREEEKFYTKLLIENTREAYTCLVCQLRDYTMYKYRV